MEMFGLDPIRIKAGLIHSCGAYFEDRFNETTICHIGGSKLFIRDIVDLYLADEIFRGFSYPIPFQESCIVLDVGMNVGFAAIAFARDPRVKFLYGFEPFPRTYQMALDNFHLNPILHRKIIAECFGLGIRSETREVEYSEIMRGGMTSRGVPKGPFSPGKLSLEKIELRDIQNVFEPILNRHFGERFILKMDCEGDEFDLIPRLSSAGILEKFDFIMIEFHAGPPDELLGILEQYGYETTGATRAEQILFQGKDGNMIYAARNRAWLGE